MSDGTTIADQGDEEYPLFHLLGTLGRPHAPYFVIGVVAEVLANVLAQANVLVLGLGFDAVFGDARLSLPLVPKSWIPTGQFELLWFTAGLLVTVKVADVVCGVTSVWGFGSFATRLQHAIRVDSFDAAQRLELGFFDSEQTGDIMSVLNNDVNTLEDFLESSIKHATFAVVRIASAICFMAFLNWQLTLFLLVLVPPVLWMNSWLGKLFEAHQDRKRQKEGELNTRLETSLDGKDVIKAYTAESHEVTRTATASRAHRDIARELARVAALQWPLNSLIAGGWMIIAFTVGTYWVINGPPVFFTVPLSGGALLSFLLYSRNLRQSLGMLTDIISDYKRAKAVAKRIVGLQQNDWQLDEETDDLSRLTDAEGRVEYDGVSFRYPGTEKDVVEDVSFAAAPGQTIGIVGPTGAGKSTLVKLLVRFYSFDEGEIRIDGRDVSAVTRESLREQIGYVDQDSFLFAGTVRDNIAYGPTDSTDEEIATAARRAGAHEFITDLEDGYQTEIGERGGKLSGGQRQRIAIARAILEDPPLLILDEATSHVDNETEVLIRRRLEPLLENRTTFVIAHRLSTVRNADKVLVLEDGRLVEQGEHDQLLERGGSYARLWNLQVGDAR